MEDNVFCLNDHILFTMFEDGGVVFNVQNRKSYLLNRTAAGTINFLDGKRNIKEIICKLAQIYEEPEELVKNDIEIFFKDLIERDWIHVK